MRTYYMVTFINGKAVEFAADEMECVDGIYTFFLEGDIVAEFKRDNIAGYIVLADDDEEE